jgi:hypothetical protein
MTRPIYLWLVLFASLLKAESDFSAAAYLEHVKYLASTDLKGRATGDRGLNLAADYIESKLKSYGLQPGNGKSFRQTFTVTTKVGIKNRSKLSWKRPGGKIGFSRKQFTPLDVSSNGKVEAEAVFVGYGISAPEFDYDDYKNVDAKGKIVVVLPMEPQEFDDKARFAGRNYTIHSRLESKITNAKFHGATAVVVAADRVVGPSNGDRLTVPDGMGAPTASGVPVVMVRTFDLKAVMQQDKQDLVELASQIDVDLEPRSFALSGKWTLEADTTRTETPVHNILGFLPGETGEYLVIGAHYDHIGLGGKYSLSGGKPGKLHLGADDNASGVAGLLELARHLAQQPKRKRGVLFIAFASEELGLLGSDFWVKNPTQPLEMCVAMLNMDMIGRLRDKHLLIGGTHTANLLKDSVSAITPPAEIEMEFGGDSSTGGSDHTSFASRKIPYLFFFTGLHMDYHRPTDTWDRINAPGAAAILSIISQVTGRLQTALDRPKFSGAVPPPFKNSGSIGNSSGGYGPSFGCVPDMASTQSGVKCSDFRPGSPAANAGLAPNDVMVEFDGKSIATLEDYAYALRQKKPGETVKVKVLRNGQPLSFDVKLAARK